MEWKRVSTFLISCSHSFPLILNGKSGANDYIGAGLKLRVQVDNYTHTDRVQVYDPPHEESSSSGGSSVDSDGFGGSSGGSF